MFANIEKDLVAFGHRTTTDLLDLANECETNKVRQCYLSVTLIAVEI